MKNTFKIVLKCFNPASFIVAAVFLCGADLEAQPFRLFAVGDFSGFHCAWIIPMFKLPAKSKNT